MMPLRGQNADPRMTRRNESLCIVTRDSEETYLLGKLLGEALRKGDVVALRGDLGSGKTVLTQGIARGIGVHCDDAVTSPTFTLVNEYPGRQMPLYHFDLYRLSDSADLEETGFEEYLQAGGVMVIEWAEKARDVISAEAFWIDFSYSDEKTRSLMISGPPERILSLQGTLSEGGF
jgi:tRNA threonylcarbamoyladenosine biosynthesis protein TsaE